MTLSRLLVGLWATANAFLGPVAAPRRAARLHVIETAPGSTEQEIYSEATSISGALAELWSVVANPPPPGDFRAMYFPQCEGLKRPQTFQALFEHLEVCKDSSQNFGAHIHAMPGPSGSIIVKNVPRSTNADVWDEWADEDDDDFLSEEMRERLKALDAETAPPAGKCPVAHDLGDEDALKCSKDWVNAIVSDAGICPFSLSADRAGLPLGDVRYDTTRAADTESCFQWFWKEVKWLEENPRSATSLLLMTHPSWTNNFDAFEQFGDALTQALQSATESKVAGLGFEGQIQLVFFHPQYVFRDGGERAGADAAANYGRRSPIPMVNILRTPQVKAAQRGLPTGLVYSQNEETLGEIGADKLEDMLRTLDWSPATDMKVDRSKVEVLRIARGLMAAGGGIQATDDLTLTGGDAAKAAVEKSAAAEASEIVVADWSSATDPASGSVYYYNTKTGATSWVWPPTVLHE